MKRLFLCLCIIAFTVSCSKSDNNDDQNIEPDVNFFALTVGNSWVYKNYQYNPDTDSYVDTGVIDSISIIGVQDFSGDSYFKFRRMTSGNEDGITFCNPNGEHIEFLREFEGNLINEEGFIKFTNANYEERLIQENPWGNIYEKLVEGEKTLSVEAGDFECINSERYAKDLEGEQLNSLDRFYYASGYGLIYDTSSFVTSDTPSIIRRLYTYEIQ